MQVAMELLDEGVALVLFPAEKRRAGAFESDHLRNGETDPSVVGPRGREIEVPRTEDRFGAAWIRLIEPCTTIFTSRDPHFSER